MNYASKRARRQHGWKTYLLAGVAVVALSVAVPTQAAKWQPHADIVGKPGSERHIGELDVFIPTLQNSTTMLFLDLRGQIDDNENYEGNAGLGLRHIFDESFILGGYAFYDIRRTENENTFYQGVFGVEALSDKWDVRFNGYLPFGDEKQGVPGAGSVVITGTSIALIPGFEKALRGFDGEIGYRLPIGEDLRVYLGGYHFYSDDEGDGVDDITGPRARIEMRLHGGLMGPGSRLTLGGEVQWDEPRGTQGFGVVRLRIPFGIFGDGTVLTGLDRRMVDPVVRDVDIVSIPGQDDPEAATNPNTGAVIDGIFFAVEGGGGTGALGDPDDLDGAITSADTTGPGIVVAYGAADHTQTANLEDGEILMGGGGTVNLVGAVSGQTVAFTAPGTPTTLAGESPAVVLANANIVTGLTIDTSPGGADVGIIGTDITDFDINNNTITNNTAGIQIFTTGGFTTEGTIDDNLIDKNHAYGVLLHNYGASTATQTVTLTGNDITGTTGTGGPGDGVRIENNASANAAEAIQTVTLADNMITGNTGDGVDIFNRGDGDSAYSQQPVAQQTVTLTGNTIDLNDPGVAIRNNGDDYGLAIQTVEITGNSISYNTDDGVRIYNSASNTAGVATQAVTLTNNTIVGNTGDGVDAEQSIEEGYGATGTQTLTLIGNTISGNTDKGVEIDQYLSAGGGTLIGVQNISLINNTITGNLGGGVYVYNFAHAYDSTTGLASAIQTVTLSGNIITGNAGIGGVRIGQHAYQLSVYMTAVATQVITLTNNTISGNTSGDGVRIDNRAETDGDRHYGASATQLVTLTGNAITGNAGDGVEFNNTADEAAAATQTIILTDNTITGNADDGVEFSNYANSVTAVALQTATLTGNTITGNADNGLEIKNESDSTGKAVQIIDLSVTNNIITGNGRFDVYIYNDDDGVSGTATQFVNLGGVNTIGTVDVTGDSSGQFVVLP